MSNYTQTTDFSAKDALTTGDPEKVILGADVDVELAAIAAAMATKFDTGSDGAGSGLDADSVDGVGPVAVNNYTPTMTGVTNIQTVTGARTFYFRFGSFVLVTGRGTFNVTTTGIASELGIALPVASNLGADTDLAGMGAWADSADFRVGRILGDSANDRATMTFIPQSTGDVEFTYHFAYRII